jgi:nucleotide-binding universal stress UspA family protein
MYNRILVPLDGSELAEEVLPYVRILGKGLVANIELLRVFEALPPDLADSAHGLYPHRVAAGMRDRVMDYLKRIGAPLTEEGLTVSFAVHEGDPASLIVSEAETTADTLIAMSTHGRSGITRWALGSVTDKVLHAANHPMLVIRPKTSKGVQGPALLNTIIVPLDGSALGEQVLPHVVDLAGGLAPRVLLIRATPATEEYYRYMEYYYDVGPGPSISRVYQGPYEEFSKEVNALAMEYLHQVRDRLRQQGVSHVEEQLLHGDPASAIVIAAQTTPNSLVAMATHGRSGVGRWVLGSVTDRVVRYSGVPVLVIRATERGPGPTEAGRGQEAHTKV